ncbi:PKD domain-containing protein [Tahibacter amnicola]|uniref:PKD domain-containing protein n=1 Tax=Tahibacter amnicola TaxID=2976241 RepID=A0ABY6B710_9GAMM|nr:PKD domain-containing protein [Tahibacter amnicola]UXI65888.1 PKD domain-containing protein [Tahibacter amnicola]
MPHILGYTRTFLFQFSSAALLLLASGATVHADPTGSLSVGRDEHMAAKLPDGRVLIAGGDSTGGYSVASAEIYDPSTGTFTPASSLLEPRSAAGFATLADGRVLMVGGVRWTPSGGMSPSSAEIYDPSTGSWSLTAGSPLGNVSAMYPTTVTLLDGKVLLVDGRYSQVFDPTTSTFGQRISLPTQRSSPAIALLPDGRVLMAGGQTTSNVIVPSADIWDPATNTWTPTGAMATARTGGSATRLADGRILVAGGHNSAGKQGGVEVFDPATLTFSATGSLAIPRSGHTAIALADGGVLVSGGYTNASVTSTMERYDPVAGTWSSAGSLASSRTRFFSSTLLDNGNVLFAGGPNAMTSAELYTGGTGPANLPPVANFSHSASNLTVSFLDASSDPDGAVAARSWNFGDGTTSTTASPVKTYASSGTYNVTLMVTDNIGSTHTITKPVTVTATNFPPTANYSFVTNGLTATFTDGSTDSDGTIASRSWSFGDGTTSTATNPSKTYAAAGTYSVQLTVTDNKGATHTVTKSVTVAVVTPNVPPVANFSVAINGLTITLTDSSTDSDGTIVSRYWSFGDGTTSTATNPVKTYAAAGTYLVALTVTDNRGATYTRTTQVVLGITGCGSTVLCNGVPVTGLSATTGSTTAMYTLVVPAGAKNLKFTISGGVGDADLYVKFGSAPTVSSYDCRPYQYGNAETCTITNVQAGTYYVTLRAYNPFNGVSLTGSYTNP